jgi:retron-type reverse transcriptase
LFPTESGTPQGGLISPILANATLNGIETLLKGGFYRTTVKVNPGEALEQIKAVDGVIRARTIERT